MDKCALAEYHAVRVDDDDMPLVAEKGAVELCCSAFGYSVQHGEAA